MTVFIPNCRVDVLRGSTEDAFGDEVDSDTAVATGVPAAVTEQRQRTYQSTEDRAGVVEYYTVRLRPGVDIQEGDRLRALGGAVYLVDEVTSPPNLVGLTDVRATCRKVSAHSV